jgi:hypothetical protein
MEVKLTREEEAKKRADEQQKALLARLQGNPDILAKYQ